MLGIDDPGPRPATEAELKCLEAWWRETRSKYLAPFIWMAAAPVLGLLVGIPFETEKWTPGNWLAIIMLVAVVGVIFIVSMYLLFREWSSLKRDRRHREVERLQGKVTKDEKNGVKWIHFGGRKAAVSDRTDYYTDAEKKVTIERFVHTGVLCRVAGLDVTGKGEESPVFGEGFEKRKASDEEIKRLAEERARRYRRMLLSFVFNVALLVGFTCLISWMRGFLFSWLTAAFLGFILIATGIGFFRFWKNTMRAFEKDRQEKVICVERGPVQKWKRWRNRGLRFRYLSFVLGKELFDQIDDGAICSVEYFENSHALCKVREAE